VPSTSVHAGRYRPEDKLKIQIILKLNTTKKKQTTKHSKTLGQQLRWAYSTMLPSPHKATSPPKPYSIKLKGLGFKVCWSRIVSRPECQKPVFPS